MDADWSNLPVDIVAQVAARVQSVADIVAFSIVCRSWRCAFTRAKSGWSPRIPWLMLAEESCTTEGSNPDDDFRLRKFFDPSADKCYRLRFPKTLVCWGSAYGWITAIDLQFDIFMFNPLTGDQVNLPSAHSLPEPLDPQVLDDYVFRDDPLHIKRVCRCLLDRIILLKIPTWGDGEEFLAVSINDTGTSMGIARPNDPAWTPVIWGNELRHASDVAYWKGALFILFQNGALSYVEVEADMLGDGYTMDGHPLKKISVVDYLPPSEVVAVAMDASTDRVYLTVDSSDDLVLILRFRPLLDLLNHFAHDTDQERAQDPIYKTQAFCVCKLDSETKVWEYLKNLQPQVSVFVGANSTMAIQECNSSSCNSINTSGCCCRRNFIYFTDDHWGYWMYPERFGGHDIGVFSLDDKAIISQGPPFMGLHGEGLYARFCCPFWFVPKF